MRSSSISTPTRLSFARALLLPLVLSLASANAGEVVLQQATADYSQNRPAIEPPYTVDRSIDGILDTLNGWSVYAQLGTRHVAVFETRDDVGFAEGSELTFTLTHMHGSQHTLGRFRFSLTTDNRDAFADGMHTGGDVEANWTVLEPVSFSAASGARMTELFDGSILVSGISPATDVYTVTAQTRLTNITGIRLETLPDTSLPAGGPGRAYNGNFVLTEFQVRIDHQPLVLSVRVADITLCWNSQTNKLYQLQYRSESATNLWTDLGAPVAGNGTTNCILESLHGEPRRFYRVIALP
jgi:hypothetical protein